MDIPPTLTAALHKKEQRELQARQQEREEEQSASQQAKKLRLSEREASPHKLELCQKIFSWANQFRQTKEWHKLAEKRSVYGHYDVKEATIDARHCDPRNGTKVFGLPYLELQVTPKGVAFEERWCWAGYTYTEFTEPEKMAKKLYYPYLQLVWENLESGKVWDDMARWVRNDTEGI